MGTYYITLRTNKDRIISLVFPWYTRSGWRRNRWHPLLRPTNCLQVIGQIRTSRFKDDIRGETVNLKVVLKKPKRIYKRSNVQLYFWCKRQKCNIIYCKKGNYILHFWIPGYNVCAWNVVFSILHNSISINSWYIGAENEDQGYCGAGTQPNNGQIKMWRILKQYRF